MTAWTLLQKTVKFPLLDLIAKQQALGDIPGVHFKAIKVATVSLGLMQKQKEKTKMKSFDDASMVVINFHIPKKYIKERSFLSLSIKRNVFIKDIRVQSRLYFTIRVL